MLDNVPESYRVLPRASAGRGPRGALRILSLSGTTPIWTTDDPASQHASGLARCRGEARARRGLVGRGGTVTDHELSAIGARWPRSYFGVSDVLGDDFHALVAEVRQARAEVATAHEAGRMAARAEVLAYLRSTPRDYFSTEDLLAAILGQEP